MPHVLSTTLVRRYLSGPLGPQLLMVVAAGLTAIAIGFLLGAMAHTMFAIPVRSTEVPGSTLVSKVGDTGELHRVRMHDGATCFVLIGQSSEMRCDFAEHR